MLIWIPGLLRNYLPTSLMALMIIGCHAQIYIPTPECNVSSLVCPCPMGSSTPVQSTGFASGSGSPSDPYIICAEAQLNSISANPDYMSRAFLIGTDLDFSPYLGESSATTFSPLGSSTAAFAGILDGNGHRVANITLDDGISGNPVGLIANASGATVKNLTLNNVNFSGLQSVGLLFGQAASATVSNVTLQGSVSASRYATAYVSAVGGLAGYLNDTGGTSVFEDIRTNVSVSGDDSIGGVVGFANLGTGSTAQFTNIVSNSNVSQSPSSPNSGNSFGGFIGLLLASGSKVQISNAQTTGNVVCRGAFSSAFLGNAQLTNGSTLEIDHSAATGSLSTSGDANRGGGFNGSATGDFFGALGAVASQILVAESYSTGTVTNTAASGAEEVGSFGGGLSLSSGASATFANCYAQGNVVVGAGAYQVGGFFGGFTPDASILAAAVAFENIYVSGGITAGGGSGALGGFIGMLQYNVNSASFPITPSEIYYNSDLNASSGQEISGTTTTTFGAGVNGVTTVQLMNQGTFTGWDFLNTWKVLPGAFPSLR